MHNACVCVVVVVFMLLVSTFFHQSHSVRLNKDTDSYVSPQTLLESREGKFKFLEQMVADR